MGCDNPTVTNETANPTAPTPSLAAGELDRVHRFWPKAFISDRFILDSKDAYPLPWIVREVVQNFLDHGLKGSLDDVSLEVRQGPGGVTQIIVTGAWRFALRGAVLALHGTKGPEDAGANAIGLKQVLIRCCRDFGVSRFSIQGDGWDVIYHLASADEINARLAGQGEAERVQHGWLVPEERGAPRRGDHCRYVIETGNPELVAAFDGFFDMGVHAKNPYLVNPHFANEFGTLKWQNTVRPGRLFVKGQVMNFRRRGEGSQYWQGPEGVSLSLPRASYQKSIDRPAISELELSILCAPLIDAMSRDELIAQLKASRPLWSERSCWASSPDSDLVGSRPGFLIVVKHLVDRLRNPARGVDRLSQAEYEHHFGSQSYCLDEMADEEQAAELEARGCHVCPPFFELIHMPRVSDQFDSMARARGHQPDPEGSARRMGHLARDQGIPVGFDPVELSGEAALIKLIKDRIGPFIRTIEPLDPGTIRLRFALKIPGKLLSHPLYAANSDDQALLHGCRTVVANGLRARLCTKAFLCQGSQGSTFALTHDGAIGQDLLISATVDIEPAQDGFLDLEFEPDRFAFFKVHLTDSFEFAMPDSPGAGPADPLTEELPSGTSSSHPVDGIEIGAGAPRRGRFGWRLIHPAQSRAVFVLIPVVALLLVWIFWRDWGPMGQQPIGLPPPGLEGIEGSAEELAAAIAELGQVVRETYPQPVGGGDEDPFQVPGDSQSLPSLTHLDGQALQALTADRNQADIEPMDLSQDARAAQLAAIQHWVQRAMDQVAADHVREFEIVSDPTPEQLQKLELLRSFVHETTGVAIPNALFLYRGAGASGINIEGVGIGLHEELLKVSFSEALGTFVHEIAHNGAGGHGTQFEQTLEALFVAMSESLTDIARKANAGLPLTSGEQGVIQSAGRWAGY